MQEEGIPAEKENPSMKRQHLIQAWKGCGHQEKGGSLRAKLQVPWVPGSSQPCFPGLGKSLRSSETQGLLANAPECRDWVTACGGGRKMGGEDKRGWRSGLSLRIITVRHVDLGTTEQQRPSSALGAGRGPGPHLPVLQAPHLQLEGDGGVHSTLCS